MNPENASLDQFNKEWAKEQSNWNKEKQGREKTDEGKKLLEQEYQSFLASSKKERTDESTASSSGRNYAKCQKITLYSGRKLRQRRLARNAPK